MKHVISTLIFSSRLLCPPQLVAPNSVPFCDNLLSIVRASHICMDVEIIHPRMKYLPVVISNNEEQFSISII